MDITRIDNEVLLLGVVVLVFGKPMAAYRSKLFRMAPMGIARYSWARAL